MIRVVHFVSRGNTLKERAFYKLEEYFKEEEISREQIISITTNPSAREYLGDTVMLVYEDNR